MATGNIAPTASPFTLATLRVNVEALAYTTVAWSAYTAPPMAALLFSSHVASSHRYPNKLPL